MEVDHDPDEEESSSASEEEEGEDSEVTDEDWVDRCVRNYDDGWRDPDLAEKQAKEAESREWRAQDLGGGVAYWIHHDDEAVRGSAGLSWSGGGSGPGNVQPLVALSDRVPTVESPECVGLEDFWGVETWNDRALRAFHEWGENRSGGGSAPIECVVASPASDCRHKGRS